VTRARARDLGIVCGSLPTGEHNAITDVPGVRVRPPPLPRTPLPRTPPRRAARA
jgi:hypothetical protein